MKPIFRVFISSTFSDMKLERDILQRRTFPKITEYCEKKGAKFQAIDLRWGVNTDASLDQRAMEICLSELQRCQDTSPRPNFIMLLGNRYGTRPLPYQIPQEELSQILESITLDKENKIKEWYELDKNNLPPAYFLKSRTKHLKDFRDNKTWEREEQELRKILISGISHLQWEEDDPRLIKYTYSATHQEILHGALSPKADIGRALLYERTFTPSAEKIVSDDYMDVTSSGDIDSSAAKMLEQLKKTLKNRIPKENIHSFSAGWADGQPNYDLDGFAKVVEKNLIEIIDRELERRRELGSIEIESSLHRNFSKERARHYINRENLEEQLVNYVLSDSREPIIVTGASGIGKTATMAYLDLAIRERKTEIVVSRYIGASPDSTDIQSLLSSLYAELARIVDSENTQSDSPIQLIKKIVDLVEGNKNRKFLILIDALDQLNESHMPEAVSWIPKDIPFNLKLVVSALKRSDETAGRALTRIEEQHSSENIIEITRFQNANIPSLIQRFLNEKSRRLTDKQLEGLSKKAQVSGLPLYIRLASDIASKWKSFEGKSNTTEPLPSDINRLIGYRFEKLCSDENHGAEFVRHSLGYLAASTRGLSEIELQALLSRSRETFYEFEKTSYNPISKYARDQQKIPITLPLRLISDLRGYLSQTETDGEQVVSFYHRLVQEVASEKYLRSQDHKELALFYQALPFYYGSRPNLRKLSEQAKQHRLASDDEGAFQLLNDKTYYDSMIDANRTEELFLEIANSYEHFNTPINFSNREKLISAVIDYLIDISQKESHEDIINKVHELLVYRSYNNFYKAFLKAGAFKKIPKKLKSIAIKFKRSYGDLIRRANDLEGAQKQFADVSALLNENFVSNSDSLKILSALQYDLGYIEYLRGKLDESQRWMKKSIESAHKANNLYGYWHTIGAMHTHQYRARKNNYTEVVSSSEAALSYFKSVDDDRHRRGVINALAHRFDAEWGERNIDGAIVIYEQLQSSSWLVQANREYTMKRYKARLLSLQGNHDLAIDEMLAFINHTPEENRAAQESFASYFYELAEIYVMANKQTQAIETLEEALSFPDEPGHKIYKLHAQKLLEQLNAE